MKILSIGIFQATDATPRIILNNESTQAAQAAKQMEAFLQRLDENDIDHQNIFKSTQKDCCLNLKFDDSFTYIIATDINFLTLPVLKDHFVDLKELIALNEEDELKNKLQNPYHFSSTVLQLKKAIEETKVILLDDIDKLLNRGEKIEELMEETRKLENTTTTFHIHQTEASPSLFKYVGHFFCCFQAMDIAEEATFYQHKIRYGIN